MRNVQKTESRADMWFYCWLADSFCPTNQSLAPLLPFRPFSSSYFLSLFIKKERAAATLRSLLLGPIFHGGGISSKDPFPRRGSSFTLIVPYNSPFFFYKILCDCLSANCSFSQFQLLVVVDLVLSIVKSPSPDVTFIIFEVVYQIWCKI